MIWTDMPIGVAAMGGLERVDTDYAGSEIVESWGLAERRFGRSVQVTITAENQICAIGIETDAGGLGGSGDITEVSATYTERATDPDEVPISPGTDVETGSRLMFMDPDCFIFLSTEKRYTVAGKGVLPVPLTAQFDYLVNYTSKDFLPAYTNIGFAIEVDDDAQISNVRKSEPKDNFPTWNLDATAVIENSSPSSSHILAPPAEVSALEPANMLGPYSVAYRMAAGNTARATETWTMTLNYTT
jgi:hypothetical protein